MSSWARNVKKNLFVWISISCAVNYVNTHQKRFFEHLLELRSFLEDEYKLLSMPFSFRFCLYKYHSFCPATQVWLPPEILTILCQNQNRPSSPLKDSAVSVLWHSSGKWSFGYSRVKTGVCERVYKQRLHHCWLSYRPANEHSSGQLRLLPGSRPVNSRPAKRPGCVNRPMLYYVPLFCPAIIGTCRPIENRNVWTRS